MSTRHEPLLAQLPHTRMGEITSLAPRSWAYSTLVGRMVECSGGPDSAALSVAVSLVVEAQHGGEPVAWFTAPHSQPFAPDMSACGVDLSALAVIRAPDAHSMAREADRLVRSGAFGLVVLDLSEDEAIPAPLIARLVGLAAKHACAVVCLRSVGAHATSLHPMVSMRVEARYKTRCDRTFEVILSILRDKRAGSGWSVREVYDGPSGGA